MPRKKPFGKSAIVPQEFTGKRVPAKMTLSGKNHSVRRNRLRSRLVS